MPADPSLVTFEKLPDFVGQMIAEVLMVPREQVRPDSALIDDLGAESLDFLDLVFRIEEALGKTIPVDRWNEFVRTKVPDGDFGPMITTDTVLEFARQEAMRVEDEDG